jgi:hypothetical protein
MGCWHCDGILLQGKSALLCALASCRPASVAALHLCRFQDASRNAPRAVLTSIVFQLARNIPTLRPILSQVRDRPIDRYHDELSTAVRRHDHRVPTTTCLTCYTQCCVDATSIAELFRFVELTPRDLFSSGFADGFGAYAPLLLPTHYLVDKVAALKGLSGF